MDNLLNAVEEIKQKITDQEYIDLMNSLKKVKQNKNKNKYAIEVTYEEIYPIYYDNELDEICTKLVIRNTTRIFYEVLKECSCLCHSRQEDCIFKDFLDGKEQEFHRCNLGCIFLRGSEIMNFFDNNNSFTILSENNIGSVVHDIYKGTFKILESE